MNGRQGKCKQTCCRTPFGVCVKKGLCECHGVDLEKLALAELRQRMFQQKMARRDAEKGK